MIHKLCYLGKGSYEPRNSSCSLYYGRFQEIISQHHLTTMSIIPRIMNSQVLNKSRIESNYTYTSLPPYDFRSPEGNFQFHEKLYVVDNSNITSKDILPKICVEFQKNKSNQNVEFNSYKAKCRTFVDDSSMKSLGIFNQNCSSVILESKVEINSTTILDHNSENILEVCKNKGNVANQQLIAINENRQKKCRRNMDFNHSLITGNDIENWIYEVIQEYNAGTAANVISSQIVKRIKDNLEKNYINERAYIHNILLQKDFQVVQLRKQNINLRNDIYDHVNLAKNEKIVNFNLDTLSLNSTLTPCHFLNRFQLEKPNNEHMNRSHTFNFDKHQPNLFDIPEPPPNLPEKADKRIPEPPPNMPTAIEEKCTFAKIILSRNCYQRQINRNSYKMKPLHWKKLIFLHYQDKYEIIWQHLPKIKPKSIELVQFEESFRQKSFIKKRRLFGNNFSHPTRMKPCLPTELAKQLGIVFRRMESLDIELEDLEVMLLSGDCKYSNINVSIIENLCRLVTDDSINIVKDYTTKYPNVLLTLEEKSLLRLGRLSHVVLRFKLVLFILNFDDEIKNIERNLIVIRNCCKKLMGSSEIRLLFAIILYFGNFMNARFDSFKDATAFCIELLPRLKETKTGDNSSTFLEFITGYYLLMVMDGSAISIVPFPDIEDLLIASNVRFEDLQKSVMYLNTQLIKIRESTEGSICKDSMNKESKLDREQVVIFFQNAEQQMEKINKLSTDCNEIYRKSLIYFYGDINEGMDRIDNVRFFTIWSEFAIMFKEAILKKDSKVSIHSLSTFKSETHIEPTSLNGLKSKVIYRKPQKK